MQDLETRDRLRTAQPGPGGVCLTQQGPPTKAPPIMSNAPETLNSLITATAREDRLAFAELYRLTSPRLFGIARRLLRRDADASDVLQETYMRVWQRAAGFDAARGDAMAWLAGILRNAAIDRLRVHGRTSAREEGLEAADEQPVREDTLDRLAIARCLGALALAERQIILLAVQQGFSHTEVSARLTMPLGTVKSHARRGLLKLRLCLEQPAGHV